MDSQKKDERALVVLTHEQLKDIYEKAATIGANEALKTFERERKKERSGREDRRLRNTKLLLRNYHMLKEHAENSVFGRTQMEESAVDILESMMFIYDNEVVIESIKRSVTRTAIIVSHVDAMFRLYRSYCEHSSSKEVDMRRCETLWDRYMADPALSIGEIARKHHMSKSGVYADLDAAVRRFTALVFGVDGCNIH